MDNHQHTWVVVFGLNKLQTNPSHSQPAVTAGVLGYLLHVYLNTYNDNDDNTINNNTTKNDNIDDDNDNDNDTDNTNNNDDNDDNITTNNIVLVHRGRPARSAKPGACELGAGRL